MGKNRTPRPSYTGPLPRPLTLEEIDDLRAELKHDSVTIRELIEARQAGRAALPRPLRWARICFLDIDDVLLIDRTYAAAPADRVKLDPAGVAALNRLAEAVPDLRFVLATTWRHSVGIAPTIAALERNGLRADRWHEDPACPWEPQTGEAAALGATSGSSKAADIRVWLSAHSDTVARWCAVDDDADLRERLRRPPVPGQVVLVDPHTGILPDHITAALAALGVPP